MLQRRVISLLCLFLLCLLTMPCAYGAEEETERGVALDTLMDALPRQTQSVLEDSDVSSGDISTGLSSLLEQGKGQIQRLFRQALGGGAALLLIVLLCDGAQLLYFKEKDSKLLQCTAMTGALAIVLLSAGSIDQMIGLGVETIHTMNDFSKTLLPLMGAACAASGGVTAAAVREAATSLFADLLITCIDTLLVPLVYIYIGAITANAVLHQHSLEAIAAAIRKIITWALTILLTAFTAYLTISGAVSGTADAAALKAAKFAISGAVPVVGGILSDAASTILVGASILKNAIGVFGTLAVFALCLTPFLQIGMQYLMYKVTAFLAELVDETGLSRFMSEIGGAFGMILGMTGACALLLIISMITSISAVMPV